MKKHLEFIHDYLSGELTPAQHQELEAWLAESQDHVDRFVEEAFMHRQMIDSTVSKRTLQKSLGSLPLPGDAFFEEPPQSNANWFFQGPTLPILGILCCLVMVGTVMWFVGDSKDAQNRSLAKVEATGDPNSPATQCNNKPLLDKTMLLDKNTVASLDLLGQCSWDIQKGENDVDTRVEVGRTLRLRDGKARISFDCGAVLTLTGPSELRIDSNMDATLLHGDVSAVVSQEAIGFLLHTKELDVRDLGTEFRVSAVPNGETKVEVLDGEVEADLLKQPGQHKETVNLVQGQYIRTGSKPSSTPDQLTIFRGTRINFDKPDCLDLLEIQNPNPSYYKLDDSAEKLLLKTTWGSVYGRQGRGSNLFLLPIPSTVDFDVILTVAHFEPEVCGDHVGLLYMADEDNFARIIYAAGQPEQCPRYVKFNTETAGTPFQQMEEPTDLGDKPFKLRLTRRGDEVSSWWSNDGGNQWFFRDKGETPKNANYVGFYVSKGHDLSNDITKHREACIESFEIECGE